APASPGSPRFGWSRGRRRPAARRPVRWGRAYRHLAAPQRHRRGTTRLAQNRYRRRMRHLWSLLAGIVSATLVWLLLSSGQHRSQAVVASWDATGRFNTADLVGPVILLAVAGIMLGLLGTLRWSPAGPVVAGALFVTPTVLMFINPFQTLEGFFRP